MRSMRFRVFARTRGRLAALGAALVLAAAGVGVAGPATVAAAADAPPMGTVFNEPTGDAAAQNAIRDRIRALIAAADEGSTIRMALYHLWDRTVAQDLVTAHQDRAVRVQVVLDESSVSTTGIDPAPYNTLKAALGTDIESTSYVKLCAAGRSCLSTGSGGINHNKFLLFSSVGGGAAQQVVVQTSSNLTPSNYSRFWNSAVVVGGNTALYTAYGDYFVKLGRQNRAAWSYTYANAGDYKVYFFPRAGTTASTDTVVNTLDNVECVWTDSAGSHRSVIRAAMLKITRQAVADKLRAKAAEGCTVDLVYSETDTGTWNALHGQTRLATRCYQHDHDADPATPNRIVHSKNMMIDGKYAGSVTRLVFTGSHNWSGPALRDNDESMVRITTGSVYDAFLANFTRVRAAAAPGTADNVAACR
ncbi:phospholipase D-like domain-containing protein [Streptomyces sp. NPDC088124]|uniref:phospholipase D-like domain-containing protein n=1 Tax=Streptomyces sp. NPDC088124 TaxID=3154654 RepID=UPI00342E1F1C